MRPDANAPQDKSSLLKTFRDLLGRSAPDLPALERILPELSRADLLEEALATCRRQGRDRETQRLWKPFRDRLERDAEQARARRQATWQHDPDRRTLRLKLDMAPPFTHLHPPQRIHTLADSLRSAGLSVALGLEKTPRPLITFAHPLPAGLEGRAEWAEVGLREPSPVPLQQLPDHAAAHLPPGVVLLQALQVPNHATPLPELCRGAHWIWEVPEPLQIQARKTLQAFQAAGSWTLEKPGKVDGQKTLKQIEVRDRVSGLSWEGRTLHLHLKQENGEALNPAKLLGGILGLEPATVTGLVRVALELQEDSRLQAADRYAPKLHNIWEDAVLLESSDGPAPLEDEDDEEPLRLG